MRIALLAMLAVGAALVAGAVLVVGLLRSRLDDAATTAAELRARDVAALAGTDRDEIGELAAAVNVTLARLDASVERQRRFVADASHELRGPLASLRADLEISLTHPSSTDWSVVAADTLSDVERLQLLTEDLLVLARIDARHELRRHPVDLATVASDAVTAIRRDGLAVTTSGISSPAMMTGDRDQLTRMIRNLVHNAEVHATTRVDVSLHALGASLQLVVADDGPGIPAADRTRVFERFVRLDDARTRDEGDTGLGLSIAHDVVLSHRGSIEVAEPSPGRLAGATLVVTLPCRPPERFTQR